MPNPDPLHPTHLPSTQAVDTADPASLSALAPFKIAAFRMLWSTWLIANLCMWMNDVAAAWLMTSMTTSPIWVALVQACSTLPVFLLGLPSGAMADIVDRRRYLIATQFWMAVVAVALCATILLGAMTPPLLLALILANGVGLAMRWPVYSALIPGLVPRAQLPAALGLMMLTVGAVLSEVSMGGVLYTLTDTGADVAALPAASYAVTVSVAVPLANRAESQENA